MIFGLFILAVAIIISGVSAYYSIAGLTAIFTGAFWSIVIMGAALELGKISATVWIHKFWARTNWQFKAYLVPAIVILMLITSMGTFGYLSAAHLSQSTATEDIAAQVSLFDDKIQTQKDNIDTAKRALTQMDSQVDQMLGRTSDDRGANRAVQVRKQQANERKILQKDIETAQKEIALLQTQREPLAAKSRIAESHIGPIKYIAALIYGDNPNADLLERAVRWVIILLVFVFDPLAIVLILAADQTFIWAREDKKKIRDDADKRQGWHQEWVPDSEAWPAYEADDGPLTDEQYEQINQQANVTVVSTSSTLFDTEEEFFASGKEIAKAIDANNSHLPDNYVDTQAYLKTPWNWGQATQPNTVEPQPMSIDDSKFDPQPIRGFEAPATDETPINPVVKSVQISDVAIPELSIGADNANPINAGFGIEFPSSPYKGDLFLRVDYLPSRLYKWNMQKWMEVDKAKTDQYAYDQEYIKHLISKIDSGEYDVELLSDTESEQIQRYLNEQSKQ